MSEILEGVEYFTLGEVEKLTGVNRQTIKRWEKDGKISAAHRLERNNWRYYVASQIEEIKRFRGAIRPPRNLSKA